jgi:hypothetical protein
MSAADGVVLGTTQIFGTAARSQAFNVVLLAEGFTNPQQNDFNAACSAFVTALTGTDPFGQVAHALSVFRVNVASNEPGADDPVAAGGTGAAPRISTRSSAPTAAPAAGVRRHHRAQAAISQVPEFSVVLVVVNSQIYGGSGGPVGVFSRRGPQRSPFTRWAIRPSDWRTSILLRWRRRARHDHHPAIGRRSRTSPSTPLVRRSGRNWAVNSATALPTMSNPDCASIDNRASPVPTGTVEPLRGRPLLSLRARPEMTARCGRWACRSAAFVSTRSPRDRCAGRRQRADRDDRYPPPSATVAGEVAAFTGWAVDDSGIAEVRIYRSAVAGERRT